MPSPSRVPSLAPLIVAAVVCAVAGCGPGDATVPSPSPPPEPSAAGAPLPRGEAVTGASVYVPVYSHIFFQDEGREIDLAATVSIRNTDPEHPLTLTRVRYYDSDGRLVRQYGEGPVTLAPLASRAYVVEERDRTGGVGANFLVEWEAAAAVSAPVAEAVMISTASTQGISFVSRGVPVRSWGDAGSPGRPPPVGS